MEHFSKSDPVMAAVVRRTGPFALKQNKKYFIVLCQAIVSQQISTRAAETIARRFHALFDGKVPTPARVATLTEERLRSAGLSRQKSSYILDLGQRFLDKSIQTRSFHALSNDEIVSQLTEVRGVGRWTAEMFLIFSLNRMDVLPVDDLGFRAGLKSIYNMKALPDAKRIRVMAKKWRPYETAAAWYAWRSLNPDIVAY